MTPSTNDSTSSSLPDPQMVHATPTEKLQSLTASERSEMQEAVDAFGPTYVLAHWNLLLEQSRYLNAL